MASFAKWSAVLARPASASIGFDGFMVAVSTLPKGSQISPVQERVYHQSNLIGDWKGS